VFHSSEPQINHKIVQIIVDKLGYTPEEVISYLQNPMEKNSFVSNLYQRLLDEDKERNPVKMQTVVSSGSLGVSGYGAALSQGFGHHQP
jgi:predicted transcriptional regulator